jgi:hypothetical protein
MGLTPEVPGGKSKNQRMPPKPTTGFFPLPEEHQYKISWQQEGQNPVRVVRIAV